MGKYNKTEYYNGPASVSEVVSNKYDIIHKNLFNDALESYYYANQEKYSDAPTFEKFLENFKIIELKSEDYNEPSFVLISTKKFPFKQEKINLAEYWNPYQFGESNKDVDNLMVDEDTLIDAKLIYINYANGKCKFRSKFTGKEFWTTIDYITRQTNIDIDEMTLEDTFTYLINK